MNKYSSPNIPEIIRLSSNDDDNIAFINRYLPINRLLGKKIFVALDFDATFVDNDGKNLEVDFTVVKSVLMAALGLESERDEQYQSIAENSFDIDEAVRAYISPLDSIQQDAIRKYLSSEQGKKFSSFEEYKAAMAGKPINKLLAEEIGSFIERESGKPFLSLDYIDNTIVKNVEVRAINEFVPKMIKKPISGWEDFLDIMENNPDIHVAIVTSSENLRVFSIFFGLSEKIQKQFGLTSYHRDLFMEAIKNDTSEDWDKFHQAVKKTGNFFSAAEEEFRDYIQNRKPHGDIHGIAFKESVKKHGITRYGVIIEDSGSLAACNQKEELSIFSDGLTGNPEKDENGYIGLGFIAASHYDVSKQTKKLADIVGENNIIYHPSGVTSVVLGLAEKASQEFTEKSILYKELCVASALAKYQSR